jgi:hypothetical protein
MGVFHHCAAGMVCTLEPVLASPVERFYRNKCEFTVGPSFDGTVCSFSGMGHSYALQDKTFGFTVGAYSVCDITLDARW